MRTKKQRQEKERYTSFYLTHKTKEELGHLSKSFGENQSAVIRRLITEKYTIIKMKKTMQG